MTLRQVVSMLSIITGLLMLGACQPPTIEPLQIGINTWPGYEFLYLAQEKGFYDDLGVPVKIVEYGSLNDVRSGYERGNLDIMATTLIEVLQVKSNSNRRPMVFLIADFSNGGDVIIARKPITAMKELKGLKIGADTTSLPIFVLARALEMNGLKLSDVTLVPIEQSDIEQAFMKGEIDAAVTYPPISVHLKARDDSVVVFTSAEIPGEVVDVVSVERDILKERFNEVKKIIKAWGMALEYAESNPDDAFSIMAKREGISVKEFAEALGDLKTVNVADQKKYFPLLKPILAKVKEVLVSTGTFPKDIDADCCVADM